MRISSSQHTTYKRCHRLWWFLYVMKLPTPPKSYYDFGTILHEVCERYLLADALGRVPAVPVTRTAVWPKDSVLAGQVVGRAVQLYPAGWDATEGRKIPPVESYLIQKLIEKAIAEGALERQDGRKIEHWFSYEIIKGVDMVGMIDVLNPGEIQDHKTTKDMKWAETTASLPHNVQMLNYARVLLELQPHLALVRLRHNVYCKNPKKLEVRKVEVIVSKKTIMQNYEGLVDTAEDMKELANHGPALERWAEVEGPNEPGACSAFGGCPMRAICGFKLQPHQYIQKVHRQIKNHDPRQKPTTWAERWGRLDETTKAIKQLGTAAQQATKGMKAMVDIFKNVRKPKPSQDPPVEPGINGGEVAPTTASEPSEPTSEPTTGLPWAFSGCRACGSGPIPGLNTKGGPCFICRTMQKKAGNRTDLDFDIERDTDGIMAWAAKDGSSQGVANLPSTPVKSTEKVADPEPEPEGTVAQPPENPVDAATAALAEAEDAAIAAEIAKAAKRAEKVLPIPVDPDAVTDPDTVVEPVLKVSKRKGRPKRGYRIYVDCMPTGVKTTLADTLFVEMASEIAAGQGEASFYDLNPFKRRELWYDECDSFQERLGNVDIVVRNPQGSPDLKAFIDALISVAQPGNVIQGMS